MPATARLNQISLLIKSTADKLTPKYEVLELKSLRVIIGWLYGIMKAYSQLKFAAITPKTVNNSPIPIGFKKSDQTKLSRN